MTVFASLFSGFGLADVGAQMAVCELAWGIELDPAIAEVSHQLNHQVYCQSVTDTDWLKLEKPDILWASPPCPNFSIAKAGAKETEQDKALARAVVDALKVFQPQVFILENVEGYKRSKSLEFIEGALFALGYWCDRQVVNAADFGVPQTRRRLILRAVKGGFVPMLPPALPWQSWYGAAADLIPDLPETQLAQWQLERLPDALRESLLVCGMGNRGESVSTRTPNQPALTVTKASDRKALRAVLVESKNANQQYGDGLRWAEEPATTVITDHKPSHQPKALLIPGGNANSFSVRLDSEPARTVGDTQRAGNIPRAVIDTAKIVQLSSRCLARFQTVPDWYKLPAKNSLACKGIGNGVPCKLSKELILSLLPCVS